MGIVYVGPYADEVNHPREHDGYALHTITPDGRPAMVGACSCGWHSTRLHPQSTEDRPDPSAAEDDFETQHLAPLIEQVMSTSWSDWAARSRAHLATVVEHIEAGRPRLAGQVLDFLRQEVTGRIRMVEALVEEETYERLFAEGVVTARPDLLRDVRPRPFGAIRDTAQPAAAPAPELPPPTAHRRPHR
jgi:hypothetical protein